MGYGHKKVTYTIGYSSDNGYYLEGDDGTQSVYFKPVTDNLSEVTLSMGSDVTIRVANPYGQRLVIGTFHASSASLAGFDRCFDTDIDVTVTSASRYIAYMELHGYHQQAQTLQETHNDQQSCTMEWRHVSSNGTSNGNVGKIVVTYSSTQYAYRLSYELNDGKASSNTNPAYYETATGLTLSDLTRNYYDFGGWYDNAGLTGSALTSIAAGTTGERTLYAKWTPTTYTISYVLNGGTNPSNARTSYTIETPTFNLPEPTRSGYAFRGWYLNEDFASAQYTQIREGRYHRDFTFYAKWEEGGIEGKGTQVKPYKITNEAQLRALAEKVNGGDKCSGEYYQQTCDITITGGDWTPIGNDDNYFAGIYDGGNYTISGIRISSTSKCQGLFGKVTGTTDQHRGYIQNIILENSAIAGGSYTGGIVGCLVYGHVKNCYVRSSVTVQAGVDGTSSSNQKRGFGGMVGYFQNGTVTDCTSMATVNDGGHEYVEYFGGVIGYMTQIGSYTTTATDCFSYGMKAIGGLYKGTATNVKQVYQMRCTDGSITLPDAVGDADGFYYDGIGYYKAGVSVPLTVTLGEPAAGYALSVNYNRGDYHGSVKPNADGEYILKTNAKDATVTAAIVPDPVHFSQSGDTYTIHTAEGWGVFCDALQDNATYNRFSGKTVKLGKDIEVSRMTGTSGHDFCGTFDGGGYTLTFNYGTSDAYANVEYAAPFHYVSNAGSNAAAFKDLHVADDIYTSAKYAAGLIAQHWGTVNVENCRVSTVIHSSVSGDGTHGGFEAVNVGELNITGSLFDGKLLTTGTTPTNNCGGFMGWHNGGTTNISHSIYAPAVLEDGETEAGPGVAGQNPSATFGRNAVNTLTNSYYTRTLGTVQGLGYSFATAPANIGTAGTAYSVSGITPYTHGLGYDGRYYMTPEAVTLVDNAANDVAGKNGYFADVTLTGRTLYKDGDWNTLCLPFALELEGSPFEGADARSLSTASLADGTLTLDFSTPVTALVAGTPYIIRWNNTEGTEDIVSPTFSGVTIDATDRPATSTDGKVTFLGTYDPIEWTVTNTSILFLGTQNTLYYPQPKDGKNPSINPFRAYFELSPSTEVKAFKLNFGDGETSRITTTDFTDYTNYIDAWYSLDGRRLNSKPSLRGVYINNGKKIVIK